MEAEDRDRMRRVLVARLESLQSAGVLQLPRVGQRAGSKVALNDEGVETPSTKVDSPTLFSSGESSVVQVSSAPTLEVLQQEVAGCTRCEELARTRTQTVFGVGNSNARLCFIGEAPGADEDKQGEPFVGRAGQLLNKIIEACRMKREDVYILNMIKCRPPGNRNPLPEELSNCAGYLERQLALIRAEFICCLGAVAAQNLLGTTLSIGKLRGKVHMHRGARIVCTYHPAYLLRNPAAKKDTWDDMKFLMREMGVEVGGRSE
jgi:uracil-DNA glycosylase